MMKFYERNRQLNGRRKLARLLALLFVIYAFADVSVLQAHCGNETVGIPPYAQQIQKIKRNLKADTQTFVQTVSDTPQSSQQNNMLDLPTGDEECFCCCPHILLGLNLSESVPQMILSVKPKSTANFSLKHLRSDNPLTELFRPPRLA